MSRIEISDASKPVDLAGHKVRVIEGPLQNFEGICEWSSEKRVRVLLSMFNGPSVVEMSRELVGAV